MIIDNLTFWQRIVLIIIVLIWIANLIVLIYALVYANSISIYKKNVIAIGLAWLVITAILKLAYNSFRRKA
jgi:hypothetical protein